MKDQSFDNHSLSKEIKKSDFYKYKNLNDDIYFNNQISEAYKLAHELSEPIIKSIISKGKIAYFVDHLPYKLVLRKLHFNVKNNIQIGQLQRNDIVRNVTSYMQEGVKSKVFCLDVKSFYESIHIQTLLNKINDIKSLSYHSKKLIEVVINKHHQLGGSGVPRGLELSSLLADLYLKDFDEKLNKIGGVFLYKRFVDDIFIITEHQLEESDFLLLLNNELPHGLYFNNQKTQVIKINKRSHSPHDVAGKIAAKFDYLGYKITVIDTHIPPNADGSSSEGKAGSLYRKITVGISDKKTKKIKTKICKAFHNFNKNTDFQLLIDRVTFLSTNRYLINKDKNRKIPTGIFYNYPLVNDNDNSLRIIDDYIRSLVLGSGCRLSKSLKTSLTKEQKSKLLRISFVRGFNEKIHKKYSLNRLKYITRIWK